VRWILCVALVQLTRLLPAEAAVAAEVAPPPPVQGEEDASPPAQDEGMTPAPPPPVEELPAGAAPESTEAPTLDQFKEALTPYGRWIQTPEYGLVWVPRDVTPEWRPYSNGQWEYDEQGWTFVASEPWGWAPFHYGRWFYEPRFGWAWVPGYRWAPAWVTWRLGADVVAWAPLGPVGVGVEYYGAPSLWLAVRLPFFGRPLFHSYFVPTAHIGPVLRHTHFAGVPRGGYYFTPPSRYAAHHGAQPHYYGAPRGQRGVPSGQTHQHGGEHEHGGGEHGHGGEHEHHGH
jgi:hypothetical protein